MKVYRGSSSKNFEVRNKNSRYGFEALFMTQDIELARLYAKCRAEDERIWTGGFVYETEVPDFLKKIDFNDGRAHSSNFRNGIYKLKDSGIVGAHFVNIVDYPSEDYMTHKSSDVVVVFELNLLGEFRLVESNIK